MRRLRPWLILLLLLLLAGGLWGGVRIWHGKFCDIVERRIAAELDKEQLRVEIGKLVLDPFRGLVAQKLRLYGGSDRQFLLARVDELRLDIDLARFLHKEQFLRNIELDDASLVLPLDPADPRTNSLRLNHLDARIVASGDRFEIRRATADFYGIDLDLTGSLLRPSAVSRGSGRRPREKQSPLEFIRQRRDVITRVLHELHRLRYEENSRPRVTVRVEGDLDDPQELRARATLEARRVGYGAYTAGELLVEAEHAHGEWVVKSLRLRDQSGQLHGEARWSSKEPGVPFRFESTADLPALLRAAGSWQQWREVVFYPGARVSLSAEGRWMTDARPGPVLPFDARGHIECGKFNSRGVIIEGLQSDFYLRGNDFHLRECRIEHRTGTLSGRALREKGEWKYHAQVRLNPRVVAPFLPGETLRAWVEDFEFDDSSGVAIEARGSGAHGKWIEWDHSADIHLARVRFRDLPLQRADTALAVTGGRVELNNLRVSRPEGDVTVQRIISDRSTRTVEVFGLSGEVHPAPVVRRFSPRVADWIEKCRFSSPPTVGLAGTFGINDASRSQYAIQIQHRGTAEYPLGSRTIPLADPAASIRVTGPALDVNLRCRVQTGTRFHQAAFRDSPDLRLSGRFDLDASDGDATRWTLGVTAPGVTEYEFAGQKLPLQDVTGTLHFLRDRLEVDRATARLFGGKVTGTATIDRISSTKDYSAALQFDGISFAPLATLFSPGTETGGQLSGGIRFLGSTRPDDKLRGSGSASIKDGNVFAIPLLGPLSPLISAVLPGTRAGYGKARQAGATFRLQNGVVAVRDFEALTTAFVIKGGGDINYETNRVDLGARLNTRGPTGILLFPVSKLLEYEATGTVKEPGWQPKVLSLPSKIIPGLGPSRPPVEN